MLVVLFLFTCVSIPAAHAQSVSVSPGDLSFGVPTVTPTPASPQTSAPDFVIVSISGTGSVSFSPPADGVSVGGPDAGDFVIEGNSCTGAITAPNTCQVTLHFTAPVPLSTTLRSATLTIVSSAGTLTVPMNGAYGAVKLFSALDVNPSLFSGVTWPNSAGNPVKTATVNLSCPSSPTAVLSSTPDGSSNVFQDNTIQVANKVGANTTTTTNVCYGGDTNFQNFAGFPAGTSNCFQSAYESYASTVLGMSQRNPDLVPGLISGYGVQPLNLMSPPGIGDTANLYAPVLVSGNQTLTVQLIDAGGDLGAATLHLATNCSLAGVTPGGTITGNPITSGNVSSQTQTFTFDNGGGQNISIVSSEATAIQQGTVAAPNGVVPIVTNFGIPQTAFDALIIGTSAAPAVCLRLTGEINPVDGTTMCKGFQIQCFDPTTMTTSGDNCVPSASAARNLFDAAQYASPDAPAGANFLASACQNYMSAKFNVSGGTCATPSAPGPNPTTLVGPGILLGGDNWLTAPYAATNCTLTGTLSGDLCPLDTMTQFLGAADAKSGSTTTGRNSIFVPVVNMPEPFTSNVSITGATNGWVKTSSATANFTSNQATYSPTAKVNPPANNFVAAPPYSLTYGISKAGAPIPDTTYPVAGDVTNYNAGVQPNFAPPVCKPAPPNPFVSTGTFSSLADGIYNVHYFTTDCAFTEELLFTPITGDPNANWASFQVIPFGVDTAAPTLKNVSTVGPILYLNQPVSFTFECDDATPGSGIHSCDTSASNNVPATTTTPIPVGPASYLASVAIPTSAAVPALPGKTVSATAQDFAGNTVTSPTQTYSVQYETPSVSCGVAGDKTQSRVFSAPLFPYTGDPTSVFNVKKGHSIPVKFRVCDYNGVSVGGANQPVIASTSIQMIGSADKDMPEDIADAIEDTDFDWHADCQAWIYNLTTRDKESHYTYIYTLTLKDGTTLQFAFHVY